MTHLRSRFDRDARDLISGTLLAFMLRGGGAVLAFGFNVAIGRTLGVEGAGLFFTALAIVLNLSIIARIGLDNAIIRLVAAHLARDDKGRAIGVVRLAMRSTILAGAIGCIGVIALSHSLAARIFDEPALEPLLYAMAFGIISFSIMTLWSSVLRALERVRDSVLVQGVIYPLVGLAAIWPLTQAFGVVGAGLSYLLGTTVAALVGYAIWRRCRPDAAPITDIGPELRASALPLWPMNIIAQGVLPTAPLLLLTLWGTAEEVGLFGVATRVAFLVMFFLMSMTTVMAPKFSALHAKGDQSGLIRAVRRGSLLTILLSVPMLLVLIIAPGQVMSLFGSGFAEGSTALVILALGQAVNAATGTASMLLLMSGHETDGRKTSVIALFMMLLFALMLIPPFGLTGAAVTSTVGTVAFNVGSLWYAWRRLGFLALPTLNRYKD